MVIMFALGLAIGALAGWALESHRGLSREIAMQKRHDAIVDLWLKPLTLPSRPDGAPANAVWLERGTYDKGYGYPLNPLYEVTVPGWYVVERDDAAGEATIRPLT